MTRLVERSAGHPNKATIILVRAATNAFRYVRPDAIGGPNHLLSDGVSGQTIPASDDLPDTVCEILGQSVNLKIHKAFGTHAVFRLNK